MEKGPKVEDWNTLIGREREKEEKRKKDIDEWSSLVYWKQDQNFRKKERKEERKGEKER